MTDIDGHEVDDVKKRNILSTIIATDDMNVKIKQQKNTGAAMPFKEIWQRIEKETEIRSQNDLAEVLGISRAVVSKWKVKNDFPVEWAYGIAQKYGLSTDWIMKGKGTKRIGEENEAEGKANISSMMSNYLEGALNALRKIEKKNSVSFISCLDKIHTELQKIEESEKDLAKKSVVNGSPE